MPYSTEEEMMKHYEEKPRTRRFFSGLVRVPRKGAQW
jgi:3-deoxy-D-arabino-heptulosonate 7-phosphate (DAHP) synthase